MNTRAQQREMTELRVAVQRNEEILKEYENFKIELREICESTEMRLKNVEKKTVVPKTVSKKASIGEIVSFNLQCIAKMKQLLNRYATKVDLQELESGLQKQFHGLREHVSDTYMSQQDYRKTTELLNQTQNRHVALEQLVGCKIDRSEMGILESAKTKWGQIVDAQKAINSKLKDLSDKVIDERKARIAHEGSKDSHVLIQDSIRDGIDTKVSKEEYEETCSRLERTNAKQTHLESALEQAVKVLQSTRDQQRRFGEEFEKLKKNVIEPTRKKVEQSDSIVQRAHLALRDAKKDVMSAKADVMMSLESAKSNLRDETVRVLSGERKMFEQNRANFGKRLKRLEGAMQDIALSRQDFGDQLSVVLRFIDWFTERGSSYESNANALERNLRDLVCEAP